MFNFNKNSSKFLVQLKGFNKTLIFFLISTLLFITEGDNIINYKRIILLKVILIFYILFQLNLLNVFKSAIRNYGNITILISIFLLSLTLSYILSPYDVSDFAFQWGRIRYLHIVSDIALFVVLFFYFEKIGINYDYLAKSIVIPGIIFALFLLTSIIIDKEVRNSSDQVIFLDGIRQAGMLFAFLICFTVGFIFSNHNPKYKFINFSYIILFFTLIFLFEGRGSFISIILTYFFVFTLYFIMKKNFQYEFFSLMTLMLISFLLSQLIFNLIDVSTIQLEIKKYRPYLGYTGRTELWQYTIEKYLENPLFGKGPGSFFMITFSDWIYGKSPYNIPHTQPHNMILQFLIEWGIIGTAIMLVLLTKFLVKSIQNLIKFKKYILLMPGLGITALTAHGMVDGTFFHPTFTFLIVLMLSVMCVEIKKN